MRPPWWARLALGALVGLGASAIGLFLLDSRTLAMVLGPALAIVAFLGSFFLWTADVPPTDTDPGYEQVLFDRPNSAASLVLAVALVAVGWFGPMGGAAEEGASYLEERDALAAELTTLSRHYDAALVRYEAGTTDGTALQTTLGPMRESAKTLAERARALDAPEEDADAAASLQSAASALSSSMESMDLCLGGIETRCETARLRLQEHQDNLREFEDLVGPEEAA